MKKPKCKSCKELTEVDEQLEVNLICGSKSGYFKPFEDMPINYCPVCGRKLIENNDKESED